MLRISEIFHSIQGESTFAGLPTAFIRLTGCPLRCQYCDTTYAFKGGKKLSVSEILETIKPFNVKYITVTGGEPLAQPECLILLNELVKDYVVSLETSGAMDVSKVNSEVIKILDVKTPDSKESDKNLLSNLDHLTTKDQIKFVICSYQDYLWSVEFIKQNLNLTVQEILFSPSYEQVLPSELAHWILRDKLNVRMQVQMHKVIWGDKAGV